MRSRLSIITVTKINDEFTRFEHEGWERVADKYDSVWSSLTRQLIPHLIDRAQISSGMSVLDVACGPGYVSAAVRELSANPTGIDFSAKMVATAKRCSLIFHSFKVMLRRCRLTMRPTIVFWLTSACFILRSRKKRVGKLSVIETDREVWFYRVGRTAGKSWR